MHVICENSEKCIVSLNHLDNRTNPTFTETSELYRPVPLAIFCDAGKSVSRMYARRNVCA